MRLGAALRHRPGATGRPGLVTCTGAVRPGPPRTPAPAPATRPVSRKRGSVPRAESANHPSHPPGTQAQRPEHADAGVSHRPGVSLSGAGSAGSPARLGRAHRHANRSVAPTCHPSSTLPLSPIRSGYETRSVTLQLRRAAVAAPRESPRSLVPAQGVLGPLRRAVRGKGPHPGRDGRGHRAG